MIKIVNKKTHTHSPNDIYIGRGSVLGNPYSHRKGTKAEFVVDTREEAIALYKNWLMDKLERKDPEVCKAMNDIWLMAKAGNVNLVCYCTPLPCHGDVLKEIIESKL